MTQLKVIRKFRDVTNEAHVFSVGEIITLTDTKRVENVLSQGLAEVVPAEPENTVEAVNKQRRPRRKKVEND